MQVVLTAPARSPILVSQFSQGASVKHTRLGFVLGFEAASSPPPQPSSPDTSRVVHVHEEHVLVSVQDGVELRERERADACGHVVAFGMDGGAARWDRWHSRRRRPHLIAVRERGRRVFVLSTC